MSKVYIMQLSMLLSKFIKDLIASLKFFATGRKIDFIVAGVQKSGTSALDFYLRENAEIGMANKKEVHFFDHDRYFFGVPAYFAYHANFSPSKKQRLIGENTPIYSYWDNSIKRIWKYNSKMKVIVVLKSPIQRAHSHWNMERQRGMEPLSFLDAINAEELRCKELLPSQHRVYSYLDRGWYSEQIRRIWRFFPKEQTMFIKQEELLLSPNKVINAVWAFLGVAPVTVEKKMVHSRRYESKMSDVEYELLSARYLHEIKEVETMLGWDCTDWLSIRK